MATVKARYWLVADPEGGWFLRPVEALSAETAIEKTEKDGGELAVGNEYDVYEVVDSKPSQHEATVQITPRS